MNNIDDNKIRIKLSRVIYEKLAVLSAAQKFSDQYVVMVQHADGPDTEVEVSLEPKPSQKIPLDKKVIISQFCDEVIDQQIRLDLDKRTGKLREIIVRHAFQPLEDLKGLIDDAK